MDAGRLVGLSSRGGVLPPAVSIQHQRTPQHQHQQQQHHAARPWAMIERTGNNVAW